MDKTKLIEWQNRVGKEQATKIKTQAAKRGTKLHKVCEDYVLNKEDFLKDQNPITIDLFKQVKPFIDKNVNLVKGIELPLYSDYLMTAGRCDMFCQLNGHNTIVDYKTSSKQKKEEWIENYFLQLTTYAMMIEERYEISVPYLCVVIACEDGEPQIFPKNTNQFRNKVENIFRNFSKELL
jgi:genome maintenance exonuclease 1